MASFKKWEPEGGEAAEIFRLLESEVLKGTRDAAWDKYSKLKEHWIDTIYKRKNLNANFGKTYKRYHEYKATLQGRYSFIALISNDSCSPNLIHLFCAGEEPEFLKKAGFKLHVFNPP
jgi:hypothetical protein